jgi:hypothetical protein
MRSLQYMSYCICILYLYNLKDTNAKNPQEKLANPEAIDVPKAPKDNSGMNFAPKSGFWLNIWFKAASDGLIFYVQMKTRSVTLALHLLEG